MAEMKTFEELDCWQACRRLRMFVSNVVVPDLPAEEKYLLRSQLMRSSRSSTANVAEGYGRYHYLDSAKFCRNARGSCYETLDHLITAADDRLIDAETLRRGRDLVQDAVQLLNGYIRYLEARARSTSTREAPGVYTISPQSTNPKSTNPQP